MIPFRTFWLIMLLTLISCAGCSAAPAQTTPSTVVIATSEPAPTGIPSGQAGSGQGSIGPALTSIPAGQPTQPPSTPENVPPDVITVTMADHASTLTLSVGQRFLLYLENSSMVWTVTFDDGGTVILPVVGVELVSGAQGLFQAAAPGRALLSALGDAPCRQSEPPCMMPSIAFELTIIVR